MSAPDSPISGLPAVPSTNVTVEDFLISVSGIAPCPFTTAESSTMNQDLQQFVVNENLVLYQPAIVPTARDLGDLSSPVTNAKTYFGFQVWQSVVVAYTQYGPDAAKLEHLMADLLVELLKGEDLEPMKYCRLRHLGERHVMVVEAFVDLHQSPEVEDIFTNLTIMREGVRSGVTVMEALYLQALADDFVMWMGDMGMQLQ